MVFSSIIFLFGFLPLMLLFYFILGRKLRLTVLLAGSLLFYFWGENWLIWIIAASITINYLCALLIGSGFKSSTQGDPNPENKRTGVQKFGIVLSIVANLSLLGFFKYFNFFVDNFNTAVSMLGMPGLQWHDIATITLPLGISFYTFQAMSYTIDVYRGKVEVSRNIFKIATYITMFPQLVAGPIVRYADIVHQLDNHNVRLGQFVDGIKRFIIGLAKKVLIANTMARVADHVFELPPGELTTLVSWLGVVAYSLQIYFDFSGYSCMAIGIGKMLGFDFPENFNYPYISKSIKEFWRRWHISLSTWFRDYLYFPLGGSQEGRLKTYRNLIVVFLLCGLWHGASWNFVIWGLFHGVFLVIERTRFGKKLEGSPLFLQHAYTLLVVMIGWVFFRAEDLPAATNYLGAMFIYQQDNLYHIRELLTGDVWIALVAGIVFSSPVLLRLTDWMKQLVPRKRALTEAALLISLFILLLLCAMNLSGGTYNPFIYFRF